MLREELSVALVVIIIKKGEESLEATYRIHTATSGKGGGGAACANADVQFYLLHVMV